MANTTADKLQALETTKGLIKDAIIDKGVAVSDDDTFRSYAQKISQITGGGGTEINNQDKTITQNGVYTYDEGYTGLGEVTVDVPTGVGTTVQAKKLGNGLGLYNQKVILNYSADMLPGEASVTNTPTQLQYNPYGLIYIDRKSAYFGNYDGLGNRLGYFSRNEDWAYNYISPTNQYTNSGTVTRVVLPYGLVGVSNEDNCYLLNGSTVTNYQTNGSYYRNEIAGTQSIDYKYATFGTKDYTYIFKLTDGAYSLLTSAPIDSSRTSVGVLMDGGIYKLVVIKTNQVQTYSLSADGTTTLLGTTEHTMDVSEGVNMWRPIGSKHVIARKGLQSGSLANIFGFSYSFNDGICSVVKDEGLTFLLQQQISLEGLSTVNNVIVDNSNPNPLVYLWGNEGISCFKYNEMESKIQETFSYPFLDTPWTTQFFINPVDKVAIKRTSPTDVYVRYLDVPIEQPFVATLPGDGLQFQKSSYTGFINGEMVGGAFPVATVLGPNTPPSYPDVYGLNVTVHPGHAPQSGVTWEQPVLSSNGNMYESNFAVSATDELGDWPAYAPFSNGAIEAWLSNRQNPSTSNPIYYEIWSKNPIKIQTIVMKNRSSYATEMLGDFVLQGTNEWYNSDSWVDLATFQNRNTTESANVTFDVNATEFYTSYRFVITSAADGSTSKRVSIGQLTITAQANLVLDEGTIDISWGWGKNGNKYIKWDGYTPSVDGLSRGQVEGEKATTMGLYLVEYEDGGVGPVVSATVPSSTKQEEYYYYSDIIGGGRFSGDEISSFGFNTSSDPGLYMYPVTGFQIRFEDTMPALSAYLKIFVWNDVTNSYDYLSCSRVGEQDEVVMVGVNYNFEHPILLLKDAYYRLVFSSNNESAWADLVSLHVSTNNITTDDYRLMSSTSTSNPPSTDTIACFPQLFAYTVIQTRSSIYYLQDVYLSNDLTYIVAEPEPVTPSFEPEDDSTANAGSIKGTFSASVSYVGERPGKTAGTTWYYYKMPFEDIPTHPYIFQFMGALPKDDNYRWVKYSAYQYNPDAAPSDTTNKIGNYELVGNTGSLPTTTSIIGVNQGNTNILAYKTTERPTIEGVMLITSTKLPDSVNLVWYVKEITEITSSAELSPSYQSGELYGSWYIKTRNESGEITGTKTVYILHQPL